MSTNAEGHFEIERRYLVAALPDALDSYSSKLLQQGYVAFAFEAADGIEVRLRSDGAGFIETRKRGSGGVRCEVEREITEQEFNDRWPQVEGRAVSKTRYLVPPGIELDVFHGKFEGLVVAEVEFPDEAASRAFTPPPWFGREITDDLRYTHQGLLLDGLPAEK